MGFIDKYFYDYLILKNKLLKNDYKFIKLI